MSHLYSKVSILFNSEKMPKSHQEPTVSRDLASASLSDLISFPLSDSCSHTAMPGVSHM